MNRTGRMLSFVIVGAVLMAVAACSGSPAETAPAAAATETGRPPVAVSVAPAARADFQESLEIVGTLEPKFSADVQSEITGTVTGGLGDRVGARAQRRSPRATRHHRNRGWHRGAQGRRGPGEGRRVEGEARVRARAAIAEVRPDHAAGVRRCEERRRGGGGGLGGLAGPDAHGRGPAREVHAAGAHQRRGRAAGGQRRRSRREHGRQRAAVPHRRQPASRPHGVGSVLAALVGQGRSADRLHHRRAARGAPSPER